ncbi:MAG: DNA-binding protein [Clostridiales bacterium]|nr:DNA-binding protein [Clostridiales bacterium]
MDPVKAGLLLDFYGNLLTQRSRSLLELYYSEDMTLSEIADNEGISRQAVHDSIRRGSSQLTRYESKLGLVARFLDNKTALSEAISMLSDGKPDKAEIIMKDLYDRL